jgi:hypothetical protein
MARKLSLSLPAWLLLALSGCAPGPQNESGAAAAMAESGGSAPSVGPAVLTYPAPPGATFHAEGLEGMLAVEGGCLYVRTAAFRFLLIFPEGTIWDAAAGAVRLDGQRLKPGDRVALTGNGVAGARDLGPGFDPGGCDTSRTFRVAPGLPR